MWSELLEDIIKGDNKSLARCISLVENEAEGFETFMESLPYNNHCSIIGITGPPGAGKSTLTDALIGSFVENGNKVAVLCIDPSSPFNFGAILGDRIRMNTWYNHPGVFIRSLASRGSLGGVCPMVIEIVEILKTAGFDKIIIETVGVGQSEVEIAGIADITMVVLVPESGDEVQSMKSGLMEIADLFVVNKSDRPDADRFLTILKQMLAMSGKSEHIPVYKTIANEKKGIDELMSFLNNEANTKNNKNKNLLLLKRRLLHIYAERKKKALLHFDFDGFLAENQNSLNLYVLLKKLEASVA